MSQVVVNRIWSQIDQANSGSVNKAIFKQYLSRAGVAQTAGIPFIYSVNVWDNVTDLIFNQSDANQDGVVSKQEFRNAIYKLLPQNFKDSNGLLDLNKVRAYFSVIDANQNQQLVLAELQRFAESMLPPSFSGVQRSKTAEVIAQLALYALDTNGDKIASTAEFDALFPPPVVAPGKVNESIATDILTSGALSPKLPESSGAGKVILAVGGTAAGVAALYLIFRKSKPRRRKRR